MGDQAYYNHANSGTTPYFWNDNAELVNQRLDQDERLFAKEGDELEFWSPSEVHLLKLPIKGLTSLRQHWQETDGLQKDYSFYIIRQANSWSRLRIGRETFHALISHLGVFASFVKAVQTFGYRTKESNDTWDNFHWRRSGVGLHKIEICYVVRFFEENLRSRGDPWSLRQTAVYQSMDCLSGSLTFVLVQPSSFLEKQLEQKLHLTTGDGPLGDLRYILLHSVVLSASLTNWQAYIESQAVELEAVEEKTSFCKVDVPTKNDYKLRFADRQQLHSLRRKLLKAARILDCSIHIGEMMKKLCHGLRSHRLEAVKGDVLHELEDYTSEASYYRRVVVDLLQRSADTCELLTSILQYRAGNLTVESTGTLVQIASQGQQEAKISQKTSSSARSLTFAATVYLPASFLASVFCSNLIETQDGHLTLSREFWKFILVLVPMVIGTFILVACSEWYWARSFRKFTTVTTGAASA